MDLYSHCCPLFVGYAQGDHCSRRHCTQLSNMEVLLLKVHFGILKIIATCFSPLIIQDSVEAFWSECGRCAVDCTIPKSSLALHSSLPL